MNLLRHGFLWWLWVVILCGAAATVWSGWRGLAGSQGNAEEVFPRIRVGMSQHEVVDALLAFDAGSGRVSWGVKADGQHFHTLHLGHPRMDDLPPPDQIDACVLSALDSDGREIEVDLGSGGVVSGKRLSPGWWEYRWDKAYREFRDIPYHLRMAKHRYGALSMAVLLLASAWGLRRWPGRPTSSGGAGT